MDSPHDPLWTVPQNDGVVAEWASGRWESVYAVLSPFLRVAQEHQYLFGYDYEGLTRPQLQEVAQVMSWAEIRDVLGLADISELDRLLRLSVGGIRDAKSTHSETFNTALEILEILPPEEGDFPDVLVDRFLSAFSHLGFQEAILANEFGQFHARQTIESWQARPYPHLGFGAAHPTLRSPDGRFLLGVHWDSHFTFMCGTSEVLNEIVNEFSLEGFFFEEGQSVYWGC
jgi:hypothetical protein